jgi:phosphate transport system substrate-binding protein
VNITRKRLVAVALSATMLFAACGSDDNAAPAAAPSGGEEGGDVFVSGSSTVEPISIRVAELAQEQTGGAVAATVEGPGTGDGFKKFCGGESDISDASRQIKDSEAELCVENGVNWVELEVAIDGLSVLTSPANTAVECLDIPALYALLGPESEGFANWNDADTLAGETGSTKAPFPAAPLTVYGPGEESGTYDTLVEFVIADLAEERVGEDSDFTRADYSSSGNDNFIIEGIEGSEASLGWVGYAFYKAEQDRLKAIAIDTGDGCVTPTDESIASGDYGFSRSLFIYVNTDKAASNPGVKSYVDLYLSDAGLATVADAGYVDLPADRIKATRAAWAAAL